MDWMQATAQQLKKGAFLMVDGNPMTIGWGQFGVLWNKPTFTVYVRKSRYTHDLLDRVNTFTVSVPKEGTLGKELAFCGTKSGRDVQKIETLQASLFRNRFGAQDGFDGCQFHIECRIVFRADMDEKALEDGALRNRFYAGGDPHTMYVGEILGVTEQQ